MKEINKYLLITFGNFIVKNSLSFFLPLFLISINLGGYESGVLLALGSLTGIFFSFHMGILSDRIQQKSMLLCGMSLVAVFLVLLYYFSSFTVLFIAFFISGIGFNMIKRVLDSLVYKNTTIIGKQLFMYDFMRTFPFIIGTLLAGYFIQNFGYTKLFFAVFILLLFVFIPVFRVKNQDTFKFPVSTYFEDLKSSKVILFCIAVFLFSLHYGSEISAYAPFLVEKLGLNVTQTSFYMAIVVVPLLLSSFITSKLVDSKKVKKVKILAYSILISGIGGVMFVLTDNVVVSILWRIFHEVGDGAFILSISVGIVSLFSKKRMGGNAGFVNLIMIFGSAIGSFISSPLGYKFGFHIPHIIMGVFSIIAFIVILFSTRMRNSKNKNSHKN